MLYTSHSDLILRKVETNTNDYFSIIRFVNFTTNFQYASSSGQTKRTSVIPVGLSVKLINYAISQIIRAY